MVVLEYLSFLARQFLIDFHGAAVANKKFTMSSFAAVQHT